LDRARARHRLSKFLLRHGEVSRSAKQWTVVHDSSLRQCSFTDPALTLTFSHYRAVLDSIEAHLRAVEDDLVPYFCGGPFAEAVGRLSAYCGVTEMGALVLSAEVCDWRRFPRATTIMGLLRARAERVLERGADNSGPDHQGRQHPPSRSARRGRLGLSAPTCGRTAHEKAPGALLGRDGRACPACPAASLREVPPPCREKDLEQDRRTAIARELAGFLWRRWPPEMEPDRSARHLYGRELREPSTMRRDTAAAGKIPVGPM